MASDWTEVGSIEYENELALVVQQSRGFVRLVLVDPEGEMSVALATGALDQLRELLDRAAMPGQEVSRGE